MLSNTRRLLASTSLRHAQHSLVAASCVVGSSRDLESPLRRFSTSPIPGASPRPKLKKAQVAKRVDKIARKRSVRAEREQREQLKDAQGRLRTQERNRELKEKRITSAELTGGLEPWTEEQLEGMYKGLLSATPGELTAPALAAPNTLLLEEDSATLKAGGRGDRLAELQRRVEAFQRAEEEDKLPQTMEGTLSDRLRKVDDNAELESEAEAALPSIEVEASSSSQLLRKMMNLSKSSTGSTTPARTEELPVPSGLIVQSDWKDLVLACAEEEDGVQAVMDGLAHMQSTTPLADGQLVTDVLALYASQGRIRDALTLAKFAQEQSLPMSVTSHHHLLSTLLPSHPELALKHLHSLEAKGHTPLLATYTLLIRTLLAPHSPPHLVARGWDLYAHTRLVAHPVPDVALYTEMIQACSRGAHPSPERAIDLFTEMTVDNGLSPSEQTYNGVIRACTREGSQANYFEGLRLMRQMLETNVAPSRHTFHAVLEGAMRHGDLARARWMLVKMVGVGGASAPDANTLGLVFQTYAMYRPPVVDQKGRRSAATAQPQPQSQAPKEDASPVDDLAPTSSSPSTPAASSLPSNNDPTSPSDIVRLLGESSLFYPGPLPETSDELVAEARNLLIQCVGAAALSPSSPDSEPPSSPHSTIFPFVTPTPFLLNTYLAILAAHAPFPELVDFFRQVYSRLGVEKNRWAWEVVMDKCEKAKNREVGLKVARETFAEWKAWLVGEPAGAEGEEKRRSGKNISAIWASMIRVLAKNFQNDEALELLKKFIATYPPAAHRVHAMEQSDISKTFPRLPSPITLSSPLFPETTASSLDLPPAILFDDLQILHLRLANVEDVRGLGVVRGICAAYDGEMRRAKEVREDKPKFKYREEWDRAKVQEDKERKALRRARR